MFFLITVYNVQYVLVYICRVVWSWSMNIERSELAPKANVSGTLGQKAVQLVSDELVPICAGQV